MARLPDGTFKDWKDGDTVNATDYVQELEIIRTAVNDNDDRVKILEAASAGQIKRLPAGTAFPSSPSPDDVFFREDENIIYVLGTDNQWKGFALKSALDTHTARTDNPHAVTASQVNAYSKTEADNKFRQIAEQRYLVNAWTNQAVDIVGGVYNKVAFGNIMLNAGGMLEASTSQIVIPSDGFYRFHADVLISLGGSFYAEIKKVSNGAITNVIGIFNGYDGWHSLSGEVVMSCTASDRYELQVLHNSGGTRNMNKFGIVVEKI